jgi:tripartite-type tricarboxylate transporter receptor subunit TctC
MTRIVKLVAGVTAALLASSAYIAPTLAQNFPTQRVTIVVPFGAGSVTDILGRILADDLSKRWGQQVLIENRPGIAGTAAVAKSAPDGHTLLLTSNGHTVANIVSKSAPFDAVKDFAGITRICSVPLYLIFHPGTPAKNLKEVIALAKAQPGKLNFSSPGLASTTFIAGALFRKAADIKTVHVPFKSAPDAVTAVIRGDAHMYFAPVNLTKDLAAAGKVVAIAAATAKRIPDIPDVPTFTEAGLPFVYDSWFGMLAPVGTPRPVVEKINRDVVASLKSAEVNAKFLAQFVIPLTDSTAAFDKIIRDDTANLTQVFKEAGI